MSRFKAFTDRHVEKFISRKFLAWVTATILCTLGAVTSDNWTAITLAYIGTQALVDMAVRWKHGHKKETSDELVIG